MGCTSDVGCLGPKPRERQVYVDLIQTIHDEVRKMNLQVDKDQYKQIKERLMKKGLLRKLIDNLVSHRANILECINQNFQNISQNSVHSIRVAGLVIMDKIMEQLNKKHKTFEENGEPLPKINSGLRSSSHYKNLTQASIISTHIDQNNYSLLGQMDHRVDLIFFRFILFLLENQESIYRYILQSINYFATHRQDKLGCKSQILQISSILMSHMKNKKQTEASSKTISILLGKIKQNIKDIEIDQSNLIYFIENWVQMKEKDTNENQTTIQNFEQIIKLYFSRYFLNYQILFFSALKIFDQFLFEEQKIKLILQMFIKIIKFQDIQVPFMRGIFIYLLKYLTIRENVQIHSKHIFSTKEIEVTSYKNIFSEISKIRGFKLLTKWMVNRLIQADQIIAYNSSSFLMCYITNLTLSTTQNFVNQLKKQLFEVTTILNIKSNQIIINFLIEYIKEKNKDDRTRMILLNIVKSIMKIKKGITEQETLKNINFIINIEHHYCSSMKIQILNFMKEIFIHFKYGTFNQNTEVNINLRSKICGLFHSFYQSVVYDQTNKNNNNSSEKTISSHQQLGSKQPEKLLVTNLQKYKLVKQMMEFIKQFIGQNLHIFVLPFLENLAGCISKTNLLKTKCEQQISLYYLIVIIQQSLMKMNQQQRIDDRIVKINLQLDRGIINQGIQQEMKNIVQKLCIKEISTHKIGQFEGLNHNRGPESSAINLMALIFKNIESIKEILMINKQQYKQMIDNYKEYFTDNQKTVFRREQPELSLDLKFCHHSSSISDFNDLHIDKNSVKTEEEQSFRDIMEKIHEF